jgi:GT2 family glycosyltransferase
LPKPDISVIIVSFNTRDLTLSCLRSVYASEGMDGLEVFVVDNASTDGSPDAVRRDFPNAVVIENRVNAGYAKANNQAIAVSSGSNILLLNSDALVEPDTLQILLTFFKTHPEVAAAGPRLLYGDGTPQQSTFVFSGFLTEALRLSGLRNIIGSRRVRKAVAPIVSRIPGKKAGMYTQVSGNSKEPQEVESLSGACLIARREAVDKIGLLDESFFMYMEDIDWCKRMVDAGFKVYYVPEATAVHYERMSSALEPEAAAQVELNLHRSRLLFIRKHRGRLIELILRVIMVISFAIRWPFTRRRKEYSGIIKAAVNMNPKVDG